MRGKQQLARLSFQKDGTRPGGGVFIARGEFDKELEKLPDGTVVPAEAGKRADEGENGCVDLCPRVGG